jgi:hypothetical protein
VRHGRARASTPPGRRARRFPDTAASVIAVLAIVAGSSIACGKKGSPLPPLIHVPVPPPDFTAERRGAEVKLQFTVPSVNTDGTRPANVERLDIFRFTGPSVATDADLVKLGTKVASVPVKAPVNPDATTEADEPPEEPELKDEGLDQGSVALLEDTIGPAAQRTVELPKKGRRTAGETKAAAPAPLLGPPGSANATTYVIVGINTKGRKGPVSRRVRVPLVQPPKPPQTTTITYDENTITVGWTPSPTGVAIQAPATGDLLPGRTLGLPTPTLSYNVYDVSPSAVAAGTDGTAPQLALAGQVRLTRTPVDGTSYADSRIEFGSTRCYTVRTVETIGDLALESDAPTPTCETLKDTFPPAAPKDLRIIATQGVISLIWEPNTEKDVAGYLVLRGTSADALSVITPMPITETTFIDGVAAGTRYWYEVRAVDRAGNISPVSNRVDELAR